MAVVSLAILIIAIVLGIILDINIGVISIAGAYILGSIGGFTKTEVTGGFNGSLALTLMGVLLLFSVLHLNGALEVVSKKIANLCGNRRWLLYIAMYVIGAILSGFGAGAVPVIALIPVIAIPVAMKSGINPLLLSIIGDLGANGFRMSPITPEGQIVSSILASQGLKEDMIPSMLAMAVETLILVAVAFVYFRGWRFIDVPVNVKEEDYRLNKVQIISLLSLLIVIILVVFFGFDMGLSCFVAACFLLITRCADSKKAISSISWNTVLMVLGVGVLMNMITSCGGIELLASQISKVGDSGLIPFMMSVISSLMALFASGLGVVFPTLTSTLGEISAAAHGINISEMVAIIAESSNAGFLPVCTAGALICSGVAQFPEVDDIYPQKKLFIELFIISGIFFVLTILMAYLGVNRMVISVL